MAMGHRFGKPLVLAAGVVTAILTLGMAAQEGQASFRYSTAQVQRGEITAVVYVAGAVQPVATVPVGATVAGTVARVEVILLTRVRSGDVLAQMDPVPLEARVNAARQALAEAESRCKTLEARLVTLQAAVESGQTNLGRLQAVADESQQSAARAANLLQQGVLPQDQHDLIQAKLQTTKAKLRDGEEQLREAQEQLDQGRKRLEESRSRAGDAREALEQAEGNLRATAIRAPIDGIVVACNIRAGQAVNGPESPPLFYLAKDLKLMRLSAPLDGPDAAKIKVGVEVTVLADPSPSETFRGRIVEVREVTETAPASSPFATIIEVENPEERLSLGETGFVTISTSHVNRALKIPNAALRFTPALPSRLLKSLYEKYHIASSSVLAEEGDRGVVWKLTRRKMLEPVAVRSGITDHSFSELLDGDLKEGDTLITAESSRQRILLRRSTPPPGAPPGEKQP
ncbi:MAG: efflux RND transporter periplasmic adaptor subunit [Terriglobia bacterium]|jgi:HlyD family secretion protein